MFDPSQVGDRPVGGLRVGARRWVGRSGLHAAVGDAAAEADCAAERLAGCRGFLSPRSRARSYTTPWDQSHICSSYPRGSHHSRCDGLCGI